MSRGTLSWAVVILCLHNGCSGLKLKAEVPDESDGPIAGDTRQHDTTPSIHNLPSATEKVEIVRRSLPTDKAAVRLLQIGDRTMLANYKEWVGTIRAFAEIADYEYAAHTLPTFKNGYEYTAQKPLVFQEELSDMREGDWLVYVDLDMAVNRTVAEELVKPNPSAKASIPSFLTGLIEDECAFVAQDFEHSLNTGFMALKVGKSSRQLVDLWVKERKRLGVRDDGFIDSLPLESALMHLAIENYANECDRETKEVKLPNLAPQAAKAALGGVNNAANLRAGKKENACFRRTMEEHGYGYQKRNFGSGYCFVDPEKKRMNMAQKQVSVANEYAPGDLFYHGKDKKTREDISETWAADMTLGQFLGRRPYIERRGRKSTH